MRQSKFSEAQIGAILREAEVGVRYNTERSLDSPGDVPPLSFPPRATTADLSYFTLCA